MATVIAFAFTADALTFSNRYRSPRNPERPIRKSTRLVVLHTTEAHARSSLNKLSERGEAHYCIVENGTVYRIVDRDREAFHAGRSMWYGKEDCDSYSIGIEVVGYHDKPVTLQQLDAIRDLVANLKKIYNLKDNQIICHSHVAYGTPNRWQKRRHRGRKRCGMLFAMPSIRKRLNLRSKPAVDPDIRAGRLVQGDPYLGKVLYGSVDTMAHRIGRPIASSSVAKSKSKPKTKTQKKKSGIIDSISSIFKRGELKRNPPANPAPPPKAVSAKAPEKPSSGSSTGFAKGKMHGVSKVPSDSAPRMVAAPVPKGSPIRDLAMLRSMPGYVEGGPVSQSRSPYKIAGRLWRSPDTYYYMKGRIVRGDRVDERNIPPGTLIFYRK